MASEIRVNSLSSRTGLSTVTFTDTGPIFSGITTFQDNSGFNVGTGTSISSPASNTITLGTNSAERLRITSTGNLGIGGLTNPTESKIVIGHTQTSTVKHLAIKDLANNWVRKLGVDSSNNFGIFSGDAEHFRITSAGNIIPGTNNATSIGDGTTNFASIWASTRFRGNDNVKLVLGDSQDLVIRHDGTNNIIGSPVGGDLHIKSGTGDNDNQLIAAFKHSNASVGIGTDNPSQKLTVKGITSLMATNSTNQWMAYTYTDDTFRLNYNGAGDDEVVVTSGGNISVGGAAGRDFSLLDGIVTNTANGSAGLLINSSSSSHNAYLGFSYGSGSSTSHADQFSAYIGRVGDNTLILGTDNNIRARVTSGGDVLIGGQSAYTYDDTGATNTILDITNSTNNKRGILSLSGNSNANGPSIGTIWFNNDQNSGTGPGATMKLAAAIQAKAVTSDGNAGDDSGAYLQFLTKPESAALAESMVIHSDGYVTKPKHPSFRVGRHTDYNHTAGQPVQFNTTSGTAHLNQGNHYNTSTHRFVAPVYGVYQFSACVIVNGLASPTDLTDLFYLYKNGTNMAYSMRRSRYVSNYTGTSGYYVDFMSNVNVLMAANDYCDIICRLSLSIHGNSAYTWFSGTLVG